MTYPNDLLVVCDSLLIEEWGFIELRFDFGFDWGVLLFQFAILPLVSEMSPMYLVIEILMLFSVVLRSQPK